MGSSLLAESASFFVFFLRLSMTSLESGDNVSSSAAVCDVEDIMDANLPVAGPLELTSDMQHRGQISSDGPASDISRVL